MNKSNDDRCVNVKLVHLMRSIINELCYQNKCFVFLCIESVRVVCSPELVINGSTALNKQDELTWQLP